MIYRPDSAAMRKPYRLPLTSLIDVFFLMLVYFVISANIAMPEADLAAALRTESNAASASDLQPQHVEVVRSESGAVFTVGARTLHSQEELRRILSELPKEAGVFLRVNDDAPVWAAAAALQACHDAGYEKLTYVTRE